MYTLMRRMMLTLGLFGVGLCAPLPAAIVANLQLHSTFDTANVTGTTNGSTVYDLAGTAQNGTVVDTNNSSTPNVISTAGRIGQAFDFPKTDNQYVTYGNNFNPGTGSFTVSFWFNTDAIGTTQIIAGKGNGFSSVLPGWSVVTLVTGELVVRGVDSTGDAAHRFGQSISAANAGLTSNTWHHVALVIDRSTNTIEGYLDGSNGGFVNGGGGTTVNTINTATVGLTPGGIITNSYDLYVGRRETAGVPNNNYDGRVDDLAIWNRALNATEISTLVAAGNATTARNVQAAETAPLGGASALFAGVAADRDVFVDSAAPSINHNETTGVTGDAAHTGGLLLSGTKSPVLHFDLTELTAPPSHIFQIVPGSAQLVLYETDGSPTRTGLAGYELLSNWTESGLTYGTLPAVDPTNLFSSSSLVAGVNRYGGANLDALVEYWLNHPGMNFGLMVRSLTGSGEDAFFSRHQSYAPRLEFEYTYLYVVPEPSSGLLLVGLLAAPWLARRKLGFRISRFGASHGWINKNRG